MFPDDKYGRVRIDVTGQYADTADVLDVETGDASPATASLWVQSWHKLKRPGLPVIYCNRESLVAVQAACAAGGSKLGIDYGLWVATLDGTRYTGAGVVACQFGSHGTWDESVVYLDTLWLPVAAPAPAPKPAPPVVTLADVYALAEKIEATLGDLAAEIKAAAK